jgi:hypothetical protein
MSIPLPFRRKNIASSLGSSDSAKKQLHALKSVTSLSTNYAVRAICSIPASSSLDPRDPSNKQISSNSRPFNGADVDPKHVNHSRPCAVLRLFGDICFRGDALLESSQFTLLNLIKQERGNGDGRSEKELTRDDNTYDLESGNMSIVKCNMWSSNR